MLESAQNEPKKYFPGVKGEMELHQFSKPKDETKITYGEAGDLFVEAQRNVVNEKMFKLFVRAITEKETTGSNDTLAFLQNRIVQECVNLSERNTALILDQFNRSVQKWFVEKCGPTETHSRVYETISTGKYTHGNSNIDVRGIQNVISFLKARTNLLESNPAQKYSHYFSSRLDARYSIDVIEEIQNGEGIEISLIQLKSSMPSGDEKRKIHTDHERWVKEEWLSLEDYENSYIEDDTEEEIRAFLQNEEQVKEALLDFFTNPEGQSLDNLISSIHLGDLNNKQKAWILWKYIDLLKEQLDQAVKAGDQDKETIDSIWEQLLNLKSRLADKTYLPKSQLFVRKVRSVISVGPRIVSETEMDIGQEGKAVNLR